MSRDSPVGTGRKLSVHNTFRRRPGRLLKVLCTFNLHPVSTGKPGICYSICYTKINLEKINDSQLNPVAYLEPCQTSKMERFAKIDNRQRQRKTEKIKKSKRCKVIDKSVPFPPLYPLTFSPKILKFYSSNITEI